ncbi:MAG: CHAT domain-containing protein [Proteobacteria bacterium]|nr:CHAT domain-containing protein [Pseudomonadota bacterium]
MSEKHIYWRGCVLCRVTLVMVAASLGLAGCGGVHHARPLSRQDRAALASRLDRDAEVLLRRCRYEEPVRLLFRARMLRSRAGAPGAGSTTGPDRPVTSGRRDPRVHAVLTHAARRVARQQGVRSPAYRTCQLSLARLYSERGQLERAATLYRDVLRKQRGPARLSPIATADIHRDLARVEQRMGNHGNAERLVERALAAYRAVHRGARPAVAPGPARDRAVPSRPRRGLYSQRIHDTLAELGHLSMQRGDHAKALDWYRRILVEFGYGDSVEARRDAGQQGKRAAGWPRTLLQMRAAWRAERNARAVAYGGLGHLMIVRGARVQAEMLLQHALALCREDQLPCGPDILYRLGLTHLLARQYGKAESLFFRAVRAHELMYGADDLRVADDLVGLARAYLARRSLSRSEAQLARALPIYQTHLADSHPRLAEAYAVQAALRRARGAHDEAIGLAERALRSLLGRSGPARNLALHVLADLAELYAERGDRTGVARLLARAGAVARHAGLVQTPQLIDAVDRLADVAARLGYNQQATVLWGVCLELLARELSSAFAILSTPYASSRFAQARRVATRIVSFSLSRAKGDPGAASLAMAAVATLKGRRTESLIRAIRSLRTRAADSRARWGYQIGATLRAADPTFDPAGRLLRDVSRTVTELSRYAYAGGAKTSLLERRIRDARARFAHLEGRIVLHTIDPKLDSSMGRGARLLVLASHMINEGSARSAAAAVQASHMQGRLRPGQALIELVRYEPYDFDSRRVGPPRYAAYVLRSSGGTQAIDLAPASALEPVVQRFRTAIERRWADFGQIARRLDQAVMQPIRSALGDDRMVYLSADGALELIPFAALRDENGRYLVEHYWFVRVNSGRDIIAGWARNRAREAALVIGGPSYGELDPPLEGTPAFRTNRGARSFAELRFDRLPASVTEARRIAAMVPEAVMWLGPQATEMALKSVQGPKILHIATHGFFLHSGDQRFAGRDNEHRSLLPIDPLLRAGLAFAGANEEHATLEDGLITALEAALLDLDGTELVVLSGCETGIGDVVAGETVYGLRQAFFLAGAETLLLSLWRVDDDATQQLMSRYYRRLMLGESRIQALRNTQIALLREPGEIHPQYWASFVLAGKPDTLASGWPTQVPRVPSAQSLPKRTNGSNGCACQAGSGGPETGTAGALLLAFLWSIRRPRALVLRAIATVWLAGVLSGCVAQLQVVTVGERHGTMRFRGAVPYAEVQLGVAIANHCKGPYVLLAMREAHTDVARPSGIRSLYISIASRLSNSTSFAVLFGASEKGDLALDASKTYVVDFVCTG